MSDDGQRPLPPSHREVLLALIRQERSEPGATRYVTSGSRKDPGAGIYPFGTLNGMRDRGLLEMDDRSPRRAWLTDHGRHLAALTDRRTRPPEQTEEPRGVRVEPGTLISESVPADGRDGRPDTFVQWQGTALCMDFTCVCGMTAHLDESLVFAVTCLNCGARWRLAPLLMVRRARPGEDVSEPGCTIGDDGVGRT